MSGKTAIILAFGSTDSSAAAQLDGLTASLARALPCPSSTAWLSRHCAKAMGRSLFDPAIIDEGTVLLPILLQKGGEWRRLSQTGARVAEPILSSQEDVELVADGLSSCMPREEGVTQLIVAHGDAAGPVPELEQLSGKLREDMVLTTLKGQLSWKEAAIRTERVHIRPFLLSYGHHARKEIAGMLASTLEERGHCVGIDRRGLIPLSPVFQNLLLKHFLEALES